MNRFTLIVIFLLCMLQGAKLQKIVPFKVRDFTKPNPDLADRRLYFSWAAFENEFPFMLLLIINVEDQPLGNRSICSASLIAREWILTAGHCLRTGGLKPDNIIAVAGRVNLNDYADERRETEWDKDLDGSKYKIEERRGKRLYRHPKYNPRGKGAGHDLGIIRIEQFSPKYARPNAISFEKIKAKKICTVLGYGMIADGSSYVLRVIREIEISTTSIGCQYVNLPNWICLDNSERKRVCLGDSGSPLICDNKIWGVSSFSIVDNVSDDTCGASLEDYYSEISVEKDWFVEVLTSSSTRIKSVHAKIFFCLNVIFRMKIFINY